MKIAILLDEISRHADQLREAGEIDRADGLELLKKKLQIHGEEPIAEWTAPARVSASMPKRENVHGRTISTSLSVEDVGRELETLFANAGNPTLGADAIRRKIAYLVATTHLVNLRIAAKNFLHFSVAHKTKPEIESLLFSHVIRRKESACW